MDFIIKKDSSIIPIEVKNGKDYKHHNALDNLLSNKEYNINKGYIFSNSNVSCNEKKVYLPIYMIYLLNNEKELEDTIIEIDTSAL